MLMCVAVGIAHNVSVVGLVRLLPCAFKVHTPSGPLKSGILFHKNRLDNQIVSWDTHPASVDIPAPVKITKCLLFLINRTSSAIYRRIS